jgi:thiamine-phosphate pyrophosphorylase
VTSPRPEQQKSRESHLHGLNAIIDAEAAARAGWTPIDLAKAFLNGGARFLQFRAKSMAAGALLDSAAAIAELAHAAGAILVVNDRADIARLAAADGVHVGQDDVAPAAARRVIGPEPLIGLSTHSTEQLAAAVREPITYVAIGPVFGTTTKATGYDCVGLDMVRAASGSASAAGLPLVAIGGITLERAPSVIAAGADAVAVIGDLLGTGDPEARVRAFVDRLSA